MGPTTAGIRAEPALSFSFRDGRFSDPQRSPTPNREKRRTTTNRRADIPDYRSGLN